MPGEPGSLEVPSMSTSMWLKTRAARQMRSRWRKATMPHALWTEAKTILDDLVEMLAGLSTRQVIVMHTGTNL